MALNFSVSAIPLPIFFGALILIVAAIIVLTVVESRIRRRANQRKKLQDTYYQRKLASTLALQADPDSFLISLDKVVREFFSEELGKTSVEKYSGLIKELKAKQKMKEASFCQRVQEALYSGEKMNKDKIRALYRTMKVFVLKKDRQELQSPSKSREPGPVVLRYLTEGKEKGFSFEALKEKLIASGFNEKEIDRVALKVGFENNKVIETEKRVLTRFSSSKENDSELIKQGIGEKDEIGKAEMIEVVPRKDERVPKKKINYPEKEPESYKRIGSLDDLDRVKKKIEFRKKSFAKV